MPAVRRFLNHRILGQVDVKAVLTTLVVAAIIGTFTALWQKAEAGEEALRLYTSQDKRMSRMEDALERMEQRLPPRPPKR